ncbi:PREDICTED: phosphatidylinositol 3,4,5-trisphosphate 3-phosphatase and protein-tyrosine-phosphatase PTEN2B [Tarenaya hassleriana]|uniref:phosphatidylinositol 3,4,5-trisphosphate 3-phosphatase and protein-tyrosine-phosphatase PTEN2B n=1 Tax=Tarenaya hassleriana TaxID=28532 RepID=UPI00053C2178|nr:PREDICTED: phosphatidylinositol 3,4,5-trisphosphate 3-phosphatase and protein-tyrosine-phosphatase PTEN2B [Tarenaya hassleriana]
MDSDPTSSLAQSPAKVAEDISGSDNSDPSDMVKIVGEDPKRTDNDETPKTFASTEAPSGKVDVQLPSITTAAEPLNGTEDVVPCPPNASPSESVPSVFSPSGLSTWAKSFKFTQQDSKTINSGMSAFARFTSELGLHLPTKGSDESGDSKSPGAQVGDALESLTKAVVDSSRSAVKAVQVKARHMVSQNKRRYQEGEFDLDMTYITENVIAMGFPAGDLSSGLFGFFEGLYRNHMEEVIKFFETHHKGKYKVYNLCSERLYDASRFEGKVASFPFDDHNCPPIQLIPSFCQSAYSWLNEDIQNVVVVHCKAGMARTGLMICCLLLFLKFFPTAEEAIDYYNQKRCTDGKALVLPSQIRYVKYYERVQNYFKGEVPPGRRCMLRGFRLINCPYWIRPSITISNHSGILFSTRKHPKTKDLMPEDFWMKAPRKGVVVFALPGEPGLTELVGDFKIHFHDGDGDFYCWLNTTMAENRTTLDGGDLDGFDKRKMPAPGFHVEIVMIELDGTQPTKPKSDTSPTEEQPQTQSSTQHASDSAKSKTSRDRDDDVFSDSDEEKPREPSEKAKGLMHESNEIKAKAPIIKSEEDSVKGGGEGSSSLMDSSGASDIKSIAADASVFSFGDDDDEDFESD